MTHSKRWLKEHHTDYYVQKSQQDGYPSRSAYKLLEIQEKDRIIKPGMTVVDLGAAPGGWSVVARQLVGKKGHVYALDRLEMAQIEGVTFIQGDFNEQQVYDHLMLLLDGMPIDVVLSDMAPNLSGQRSIDQPRSMQLSELAWEFAQHVLHPGGTLLVKVFHGAGFDDLIADIKKQFKTIKIRKPKSSRARSSEVYVLGKDFLGYNK